VLPDLSVLWVIFFVLLLTVILQQLFFKPLLGVIQAREAAVSSATELAERSAAEARRAAEELDARTAAARAVVYREMDETRRRALDRRAALLAETRAEAERELARAKAALADDVRQACVTLEQDAEAVGRSIADRLAGRSTL
jgi:F-type H+-transporting ATPase subunit b